MNQCLTKEQTITYGGFWSSIRTNITSCVRETRLTGTYSRLDYLKRGDVNLYIIQNIRSKSWHILSLLDMLERE